MARRVLVAFATKMGSNAHVAEAIAAVLREAGLEVIVRPARQARDLAPYDAVVLGSALYAAHWQRDANRFVARGREALRNKPLWLWSSGPLDRQLAARDLPPADNVVAIMGDVPFRAHRTFGGLLDPGAPGVDAQILHTHQVGDFRDWERIRAYAREIASALTADGSGGEALVPDPVRLVRRGAQFLVPERLVVADVPLEEPDLAVALEGEDVGRDPVEEPAVVADDHGAARE